MNVQNLHRVSPPVSQVRPQVRTVSSAVFVARTAVFVARTTGGLASDRGVDTGGHRSLGALGVRVALKSLGEAKALDKT